MLKTLPSILPAVLVLLLFNVTITTASSFSGPDSLNAPPGTQPVLHDIGMKPSADHIERDIRKLVSFGTRHTLSETKSDTHGIGAARRWIQSEFERISGNCGGCLEVFTVSDTISGERRIPNPTNVVNVIAIQRGFADPNRYVMMSGDIDSRVSDVMNDTSFAPGANDNASGIAGTLEAARILTQYKFPASIVYTALSGEEQGLYGGKILARKVKKERWRIEALLNNDMIGNIRGINGVVNNTTARVFSEGTRAVETDKEARIRRYTGGEVDSPSRNVARYVHKMADKYIDHLDMMMIYRVDRFGRGGHHLPFNDAGYPAVRIMETNENYHRQHQDVRVENGIHYGDVISGVNFDYAAKLTGLNAVTLASMAWAPQPPSNVQIKGAVSANTTMSWDAIDSQKAPDLAGYKIYWRRTTSPTWTNSIFVGKTNHYTLKNTIIDNYFFGVASVSKDGFESPVVFPGPNGSFDVVED